MSINKILLFGGTGMLGRYVYRYFIKNNLNVCIINYRILDKNFENTLEQLFLSPNFPWYYGEGTIKKSTHLHLKKIKNFRIIDYLHFSHTFYKFNFDKNLSEINSDFYYFVLDILKNVCVKLNYDNKIEILRAKVNLQTQHKNINKNQHAIILASG